MSTPQVKWDKILEEEGFHDNEEARTTNLSITGPLPNSSHSLGQDAPNQSMFSSFLDNQYDKMKNVSSQD